MLLRKWQHILRGPLQLRDLAGEVCFEPVVIIQTEMPQPGGLWASRQRPGNSLRGCFDGSTWLIVRHVDESA